MNLFKFTKITVFTMLSTFSMIAVGQSDYSVETIYKSNTFNEQYVYGFRNLNDGSKYAKVNFNYSDKTQTLMEFSYSDEESSEVLFDPSKSDIPSKGLNLFSYSLSPNESGILVPTETEQIYRRSSKSFYYHSPIEGGKSTAIYSDAKQMYPDYSPNGNDIAFVVNNDLYIKNLESGKVKQVTNDGEWNSIINGAADWVYEEELTMTQAYEWSPEGDQIAYLKFDESEVPVFDMTTYGGLYPENYSFKYPKAGETNATVSLWIYDIATNTSKKANIGNIDYHYIARIGWTGREHELWFQVLNRHQNQLSTLLYNTKTEKNSQLIQEESEQWVDVDDDLIFLSDKKHYLYTSDRNGFNQLYFGNLNSGKEVELSPRNQAVTSVYGYSEKQKKVFYQLAPDALNRIVLAVNPFKPKQVTEIATQSGNNSVQFSSTFEYGVKRWSDANTPTQYTVINKKGKEINVLEDNSALANTLKEKGYSNKEFIQEVNSNGDTLNGYLIKPLDFNPNKEYPVLMFVYGGPGSQNVTNSWGGRNEYWWRHLNEQGYIVACFDNRGTGGRGADFMKQTYLNLGKYEVTDQIDMAKVLGKKSFIDADRIGIFGWSYGGYMSSNCLMLGSDVFKMAISVAPVTHWKFYDTIYTERFMRTPQENPEGYENFSPINHVEKLTGKLLLVHGTADDNVHFQNAAELSSALVEAGKDFDYMVYTDKNHGIPGRNARTHLYNKMTNYIKGNL